MTSAATTRTALLVAACCAVAVVGCQRWRLPAIDQTGRRIFAPAPAYTTFDPNLFGGCSLTGLQPAFTPAPPVPLCTDLPPMMPPFMPPCCAVAPPVCIAGPSVIVGPPETPPLPQIAPPPAAPAAPALPVPPAPPVAVAGPPGTLELTPTQLIAPVGSEVVLRAGVRGAGGEFVVNEPIEWILSQESVGHLVDVGQREEHSVVHRLRQHAPPIRRTGSYAVGRTLRQNAVLRRSAEPGGEVQILRGQGWVSVTSAVEGVSRISAMAPAAAGRDGRMQTAVVQWIDAQWSAPAPSIARAGQPQALTTILARHTDGTPLVGWIVRYEVIEGPPAEFVSPDAAARGTMADATTDSNGQATVQIAPTTAQSGTTRIRIQMFRPPSPDGRFPAVAVGDAFTSVTWSAPGLAIHIAGPQQVNAGQAATYHIEVANPGDMPVSNVVVTQTLPPEMTFLGSEPPGSVFGNRVEWRLPGIQPGTVVAIEMSCRADSGGHVQHTVAAACDQGLTAQAATVTRIFENALSLRASAPVAAEVGQPITVAITVANLTNQILTGVLVTAELGPGLRHETGVGRIERPLGDLAPQESVEFAVTLTAVQPGELCHTLTARADGGHYAATRPCVNVAAPPPPPPPAPPLPQPPPTPVPSLSLRVEGPEMVRVGQIAPFQITAVNTGTAPLTNVRIVSRLDEGLTATLATPGFFRDNGGLLWIIRELPVGHEVTTHVHVRCDRAGPRFCQRVAVHSDQLDPQTRDVCLNVQAEGAAMPEFRQGRAASLELSPAGSRTSHDHWQPDAGNGVEPANGGLEIHLSAVKSSVIVGGQVKYHVSVQNARGVSDQDVVIHLQLPDSLRFEHLADGPIEGQAVSEDGRHVTFAPIRELRAGETVTLAVVLRSTRTGRAAVEADASSRRQLEPARRQAAVMIQ